MSLLTALKRIYALLPGQSRKQVGILLVLMLSNAFSEVSGVAALLPFAAVASDPSLVQKQPILRFVYEFTGSPDPQNFIVYLGTGFVLLLLAVNLLNATTFWYSLRFSFELGCRISGRLLSSYLARPYIWFLQKNNADLANLVLAEIDSLAETVVLAIAEMVTMSMVAIFLIIGLLWIDPVVALTTTLLLGVLYGQIYRVARHYLNYYGEHRVALNAQRHRAVDDALNAVKEARAFTRAPLFLQSYLERAQKFSRFRTLERLVAELPRYGTETLAVSSIGLILVYLVHRGPSSQHAVPLMVLYIMATWRLVPALQTIYRNSVRVRFYGPILELIQAELDGGMGLADPTEQRLLLRQSIQVKSATFTYPGNREPALNDVSLEIPRGSVVALVGRTGSGKSTLADILAGLLQVDSGSVEVDGQPLSQSNNLDWLRNVGYVPQEIFLVDDTLSGNVALGYSEPLINQEAVLQAARTARLATFVEQELGQGYNTRLGERGVSLSGGQRQRVGIARALYLDPEFLIMDEATSALDNLTEREVMEAIQELAGQKTLVLIAHRLSTVQLCQQIYLLEGGKLVAQGTYQELLQNSPEFRQLAQTELQTF